MKRFAFLIAAVSAVAAVFAADVEVEASGIGATYRSAVNEALISALESRCGITLDASQRSVISASEVSSSVNGADENRQTVNDEIKKSIDKVASGRISGYDVVSDEYDEAAKKYRVQLLVRIPGPYVVGLDPGNRRRMAVLDFRPYGETYEWYGQNASTVEWVKDLGDKLNILLAKTRRFTMLDRKFDAELNDELARLSDANASKADVVRKCQKLATDYLVTGEVKFFPVKAPGVNPLTGQAMPAASQLFAEVKFRVLLAPTGQLKYAESIKLNSASFAAGGIGEFASLSAQSAADLIANAILTNYQPRNEADDGTEKAPVATPVCNETPAPAAQVTAPATTVRGTASGGVRLGF